MAGRSSTECYVGSEKMPKLLNEFSIVVQEYFQKRVEIWLRTVGRTVFGIEHYWVRYEFAPGRGQIHAHLLGIPKTKNIHLLSYETLKNSDGSSNKADLLGQWAADQFGLTASVSDSFDSLDVNAQTTPISIRFSDVEPTDENIEKDAEMLMKHVQCHKCSGFCLRDDESKWHAQTCLTW